MSKLTLADLNSTQRNFLEQLWKIEENTRHVVTQLEKSGIRVRLMANSTPDNLKFDAQAIRYHSIKRND